MDGGGGWSLCMKGEDLEWHPGALGRCFLKKTNRMKRNTEVDVYIMHVQRIYLIIKDGFP
jgi:hypothetical protein